MPVHGSVTGCSTCSRAFSSMNEKDAVGPEQELERAGVDVADGAARALGRRLHRLAQLRRQRRRRRLLDQLLVAALERALALAERRTFPCRSQSTWISTCRACRAPSRRRAVASPNAALASAAAAPKASSSSSAASTSRIPLPPPPAAALSRIGKPSSSAARGPRRSWSRRRCPGRSGRRRRASRPARRSCPPSTPSPRAAARRRQVVVGARLGEIRVLGQEPVARMHASQPVVTAAATIDGMRR